MPNKTARVVSIIFYEFNFCDALSIVSKYSIKYS